MDDTGRKCNSCEDKLKFTSRGNEMEKKIKEKIQNKGLTVNNGKSKDDVATFQNEVNYELRDKRVHVGLQKG